MFRVSVVNMFPAYKFLHGCMTGLGLGLAIFLEASPIGLDLQKNGETSPGWLFRDIVPETTGSSLPLQIDGLSKFP